MQSSVSKLEERADISRRRGDFYCKWGPDEKQEPNPAYPTAVITVVNDFEKQTMTIA